MAGAVVIYGATSAMGMSVAKKFGACCSSVHLVARNLVKLDEGVRQLTGQFPQLAVHKHFCDVLDEDSIQKSAKSIRKVNIEQGHTLQSVVFCVGVRRDQLLVKSDDQDLQDTLDSNLLAALRVCKYVSRQLISQRKTTGGGSIVLVGQFFSTAKTWF